MLMFIILFANLQLSATLMDNPSKLLLRDALELFNVYKKYNRLIWQLVKHQNKYRLYLVNIAASEFYSLNNAGLKQEAYEPQFAWPHLMKTNLTIPLKGQRPS